MKEKIKILHLEDLLTDAELVNRELKKSGLSFDIKVVDCEKDFISGLTEFLPDIILSDHSLPTFNSFGALKVLQELQIKIPFILITSTTSEEIAVSVMKAGAWDYILKDRMQRLPVAITNALEKYNTEKQKEEYYEELLRNERRYRGLVENIEDLIMLVDANYDVMYRSPNYERITSWKLDDKINKINFDIIHPDDHDKIRTVTEEAITDPGKTIAFNFRLLHKRGHYLWMEGKVTSLLQDELIQGIIFTLRDVTEKRAAEQNLRLMNDRYEIVLETTGEAIWDWDLITNTISWGDGLFRLFGYAITGDTPDSFWFEKIHADDYERVRKHIKYCLRNKGEIKWESEYQFSKNDNSYAFIHNRGTVIRNEEGKAIRMVGSMRDITERKLAMEEIEKLSFVASKTDNIVIISDAQERIEWVNESFTKLTGYALEEVVGRKPDLFQGPETDLYSIKKIRKRLDAGLPVVEEVLNYSKTGQKYWLRININPVFNSEGEVVKFIAVETDITRQKVYEASIVAIARELTELIEHANVPIFGIDKNGYINEWNKTSEKVTGFAKNEVLGKKWSDFVDSKIHKRAKRIIDTAFQGRLPGNVELPVISKHGKQLMLVITFSTRRDSDKKIVGALCVGQDLTEVIQYRQGLEKLVEERTNKLNEALKKEKELVEMKSKFVSIASHEFRTPLSTISLATGFIRKYKDQINLTEIDRKLDNIEKQVSQMVYLLDDVLLVGKAEAGKIMVNLAEIEIESFKKLAIEVIESKKTKHKLIFSDECFVTSVFTDEKLVRNIIINLITNAVKFSPNAVEIEMKISCDRTNLIIIVTDHGIGIPEKDIEELFTSFSRGSNVGNIEGTGLGLSIVKKAVDLLQGTVDLKSTVGNGSEFKVTLPLQYA
jgi:PAS domain S-box-containing protein